MQPKSLALLKALRDFVDEANQLTPPANGDVEPIEATHRRLHEEAELALLRSIATHLANINVTQAAVFTLLNRWNRDGLPKARQEAE